MCCCSLQALEPHLRAGRILNLMVELNKRRCGAALFIMRSAANCVIALVHIHPSLLFPALCYRRMRSYVPEADIEEAIKKGFTEAFPVFTRLLQVRLARHPLRTVVQGGQREVSVYVML